MTTTTSSPAFGLEAKLLHHVKKALLYNSGDDDDKALLQVEVFCKTLKSQHREYLRRDSKQFQSQVEIALQQLGQDYNIEGESPGGGKKKRKQRSNKKEARYDKEAADHDAMREQLEESGMSSGGLNASLRNRYKQLSGERDRIAAAAAAAAAAEAAADSDTKAVISDQEKPTTTATDDKTAAPPPSGTKSSGKKKRRRTLVIRRSSSSSNLPSDEQLPGGGSSSAANFLFPVDPPPTERFSDLGGMDDIIQEIRQLVDYPVRRPELYRHLGVEPPRGVLLRGPPGTGKTHLANAVAGELGVTYFRASAPELVTGMSGESEQRIRDLFQAASDAAPALIFLDELDAIAPKRSNDTKGGGMEKRMVAQLLSSMDSVSPRHNQNQAAVIVLAATNHPDSLDPALRRAGRFDKEIHMTVPDEPARQRILQTMTQGIMRTSGDFDLQVLARKTPGFVGADLKSLAKEAAVIAIQRIFENVLQGDKEEKPVPLTEEEMDPLYITMTDFLKAVPLVQPSSKREGFATVPDVSWDDIGALSSIREELTMSVLEPIRSPEKFQALGLSLPAGVLLYGPPGCGKTLLAKAIAHESGTNFISVKGPELLDKYVGESERAVRTVFDRARSSSPCVVFFDELDSLVPKRSSAGHASNGVSERVVNQLLTELDGLDCRRSVFVIAATNRPELIDPAMLRPGRLDKLLYVPLPTPSDRVSILKALSTKIVLSDEVNLQTIGSSSKAEGYSGADCAALLREAGLAVLRQDAHAHAAGLPAPALCIGPEHFEAAFNAVVPSVSKRDQQRYERTRDRMASARCRVVKEEDDTEATEQSGDGATT